MQTFPKVQLVSYKDERLCALAALTCTCDGDIHELFDAAHDEAKLKNVLERVLNMGHTSIMEHFSATFIISGVSRALSHQLVRHRMASYSQKSQRSVKKGSFSYVIPPSVVSRGMDAIAAFEQAMQDAQTAYDDLVGIGVPAEDARFVLPNACETQIVVTMNGKGLMTFFEERMCNCAQWEIRQMAKEMANQLAKVAPTLSKKFAPKCDKLRGCPEGARCCGRWPKQ